MINRYRIFSIINEFAEKQDAIVIAGNGNQARYLHNTNDREQNFYMVGSMGLGPSIALGMAISLPDKKVIVVEGDGNALMGLGVQPMIGNLRPQNLLHIVLNNEIYDTTGGQPNVSKTVNYNSIARGCNYEAVFSVNDEIGLRSVLGCNTNKLTFIEIKMDNSKMDIPRVPYHPTEIKKRFSQAMLR